MVWQVLVLGTQTVTLVKASFTAVNVCGCGPASTVMGCRFTGLTTTMADPDFVVSWVEVAVIVIAVGATTTGAVNTPAVLTEPAVVVQFTMVLKAPVPATVAKQPTCWLDWTGEGKQTVVTLVMVYAAVPPLQAANHSRLPTTSKSSTLRILLVSLTDVAGLHALRYQLRNVSLAMKTSGMSGLLDHQAGRLDGNGRATVPLPLLHRLPGLLVIRTE